MTLYNGVFIVLKTDNFIHSRTTGVRSVVDRISDYLRQRTSKLWQRIVDNNQTILEASAELALCCMYDAVEYLVIQVLIIMSIQKIWFLKINIVGGA